MLRSTRSRRHYSSIRAQTIRSSAPKAAGLTAVQLLALQANQAGTGAEGDSIAHELALRLDRRHWMNRRLLIMDLSDASKRLGTRIDAFLGQDMLREFAAVRIDYKREVVELEQQRE